MEIGHTCTVMKRNQWTFPSALLHLFKTHFIVSWNVRVWGSLPPSSGYYWNSRSRDCGHQRFRCFNVLSCCDFKFRLTVWRNIRWGCLDVLFFSPQSKVLWDVYCCMIQKYGAVIYHVLSLVIPIYRCIDECMMKFVCSDEAEIEDHILERLRIDLGQQLNLVSMFFKIVQRGAGPNPNRRPEV